MLRITVPETELWIDSRQEFISVNEQTLMLEHSLISLSKWESRWCKPFFSKQEKSYEEVIDYIKCMTTNNVKDEIYFALTKDNIEQINNYIDSPMTATTFSNNANRNGKTANREQITSELIYYWMVALNIPFECEKWHINRLLTLIQVCNIKNETPKKMSKRDIMSRNAALNAARRKKLNSKG